MTSRPWLSPGLSQDEALKRAAIWCAVQGWKVKEWSLPLSQVHPWSRTVYLSVPDSLPHECGHVRRIEEQGRWKWLWKYLMGPVVALALVPLGIWLPFEAWLGCVFFGGVIWTLSEDFRREEEMWGFAEGLAWSGGHYKKVALGNWRLPYLVGGDPDEILKVISRRAEGIREAAEMERTNSRLPVSPSPD